MYLHSSAAQAVGAESRDGALPRLRGRWLLIARVLWLSLALVSLGLFAAQVPFAYAGRQIVCAGSACADEYLDPETAQALQELGLTTSDYAAYVIVLDSIFVLGFTAIAAFVFWRRSDERMALFVALALVLFGATWPISPELLRDAPAALQALAQIWTPLGFTAFALLIYVFPDGAFVPRWMRLVAPIALGLGAAGALLPSSLLDPYTWPAPLRVAVFLLNFGALVFAQIYRYTRVSGPVQRQQAKWVVFGVSLSIVGGAAYLALGVLFPSLDQPGAAHLLFSDLIGRAIFGTFTLLIIPLAIGIAILRYRLWDVDPLINRTLVYGALCASIIGLYTLVVGYLSTLFRAEGNPIISLVATGLIAVLFQPLRERLQRGANRLMYGERDEPYAVLSRLSRRLEAALAPEAILPTIVETIAQALRLPYVAIALKQGDDLVIAAEHGNTPTRRHADTAKEAPITDDITRSPPHPLTLSLAYQGETIGQLILAPRAAGEAFSTADRRLIEDLARQAGVAAHAFQLTADLQRSRERLVTAREEERRRMRRDLHDGLGSTLAGLNLQAGALRVLIASDPAAADALVVDLRADMRAAIADIRRLAYELRPPALDELGLVGALRARATQYAGAEHGAPAIRISVDAPEDLPSLPAAIEVAAYRIVQEALANVIRHAHAHSCSVRLALADGLRLEIADDGVGIPAGQGAGVGLVSMRERAAELGGECWVEAAPSGGTRVRARLPLP